MSIISVKVEDQLDGVSNFMLSKARMTLLMKGQDLWDIVTSGIPAPTLAQTVVQGAQHVELVVDSTIHAALEKKDINAQRVILEAIKDHLIPHVAEKTVDDCSVV
jgi:hypothetical protein